MAKVTIYEKHAIRRDSGRIKKQVKSGDSFVKERFHRSEYKPGYYIPQSYKIIRDEEDGN